MYRRGDHARCHCAPIDVEEALNDLRTRLGRLFLVQAGEGAAVTLSAAYFFLVLFSYYLLRPVREAMGIERGADKLPWLITATMAAMLLVNPLFGLLTSRLRRRVFVPLVYRAAAASLLLFAALFSFLPSHGGVWLGYAFYVWLSVFNLFVVSVFWAVMADAWGPEAGKRVFGAAAVGGTLGAMLGALATGKLTTDYKVSAPQLMLISVVFLEAAVWCFILLWRRRVERALDGPPAHAAHEPGPGALEGIRLVARSPYLRLVAVYILLYTISSTVLYTEQGRLIEAAFPDKAERTRAFANIDLWTNALTLAVQFFLTGRVIRLLGVGGTLTVLPILTLGGFAALLMHPVIGVLTVFQVLRRGLHYAVDRPARETLFTPLGPDEKYKSKSFIDTFVYRTGDLAGAWLPKGAGAALGAVGIAAAPASALVLPLAAGWIGIALLLGRAQRRAEAARAVTAPAQVVTPSGTSPAT